MLQSVQDQFSLRFYFKEARLAEGSLWKGRRFGRLFRGSLVQDGLNQPLTESAERVWNEQSLISGWLEARQNPQGRTLQDFAGPACGVLET